MAADPFSIVSVVLDVRAISKRFGGVEAVKQASLEVERGGIVGLIGPNGAGKSTFVNLVSKHEMPDAGEVLLDGEPLHKLSAYKVARAGLTRTYQHNRLFWEESVRENVRTGLTWTGGNAHESLTYPGARGTADERVADLLDFFGLAPHADASPSDLSHVLRRRTEIAQALALAPKLLVLDEPFAGFTHEESFALTELLSSCRQSGLSMLVIDHNMHVVMRFCERLYVMHHGSMIASGTPDEIRANERVVSVYLAGEL